MITHGAFPERIALARVAGSYCALLLLVISGCATADATVPVLMGHIESAQVTEASGLTRSTLVDGRLWVINDGGSPPVLHAVGIDGGNQGTLQLEAASNIDWEAVASFELDGKSWLLVADAGDNDAIRDQSTIYVLEEPPQSSSEDAGASPAWTINFRWPDGPRDCEAVAVDTEGERILLLSKRTIPAVLYELPLRPGTAGVITATRLGAIDSLPRPTAHDLERAAPERNWHWQPTAMDISPDAGAAVILTYRAVYYFEREAGEPWIAALRRPPTVIDLEDLREAEAIAFAEDGRSVIVTVEAPSAPLYRVPLLPSATEAGRQEMKNIHKKPLPCLFITLFLAAACTSPVTTPGRTAGAQTVTIMTFNVENLFDTRGDPGRDDRTYLPLEAKQTAEHEAACERVEVPAWREQCLNWDWDEDILARKMSALAAAILQVGDGAGPDILALQEVENLSVLEQLRTEYLPDAGYRPAILIEGDDNRGIDVAFLTKLALSGEPKLHRIPFDDAEPERVADTRGILEATFVLPDGTLLTGYAVHFPAPFHPTSMRVSAYRFLAKLRASLPAGRPAFAAGDFNTTSEEDRQHSMLDRFARPHWTIVHEENCRDSQGRCRGTSYYARDDTWSFLDMILWAPAQDRGARTTWRLSENSVRVGNGTRDQVRDDGTPARFALPAGSGVSDHWPLHFTVEPT